MMEDTYMEEMPTVQCKGEGCEKEAEQMHPIKYHEWARNDAYGYYTGLYCDDCYENNYPYKKDRYPTMEYDGYGERLEPEEDW